MLANWYIFGIICFMHCMQVELVDDGFSFEIQLLARQQAQREEELAQSQRHILALQVC